MSFAFAPRDEYRSMKWQWQSMTKTQEKNFSEFRERKHLIGKDKINIKSFFNLNIVHALNIKYKLNKVSPCAL